MSILVALMHLFYRSNSYSSTSNRFHLSWKQIDILIVISLILKFFPSLSHGAHRR
jgi:hypothetical protein